MKNKYLLTFLVLVSLLGPTLVYAGESSTIEDKQSVETTLSAEFEGTSDSSLEQRTTGTSSSEIGEKITSETEKVEDKTSQSQVERQVVDKYVTVVNKEAQIWGDLEDTPVLLPSDWFNKTYHAKEQCELADGRTFYAIYDSKDEFVGYIEEKSVSVADGAQGIWFKMSKYVTVTDEKDYLWLNFDWDVKDTTNHLLNKTYRAQGYYNHSNGETYYSLYDHEGKHQGYLKKSSVTEVDGAQGPWIRDNQYVSIKNKNYPVWDNFNWKNSGKVNAMIGKTYQVRGRYEHMNGATYYSLYDSSGKWQGYINKKGVTQSSAQGPWIKDNRYVTLTKKNYTIWQNFNWQPRTNSTQVFNKTYQVRGRYEHMNGATYYSLYDNNGKWQGYINKSGVTQGNGKQGAFIKSNEYVTVTKKNYTVWQNFNWKKKTTTSSMLNKTYQVRGLYRHMNGETYYSLYDNNGKWQGYLNKTGVAVADGPQGIWLRSNDPVTITKKNYTLWRNFRWETKGTTTNMVNKSYRAKGYYNHINGSKYYSIYDNNGQWQGYLNAGAVSNNERQQKLFIPYYNQNLWGAPVGCEGVSLLMALQSKGNAKNYNPKTFLKEMPKSTDGSPYTGFVGSPFVANPNVYTAIFNKPLANWGTKYGNVSDISGSSFFDIVEEVKKGNPVVAYVTIKFTPLNWYPWSFGYAPNNNHAVVLAGYNHNSKEVYVSDPIYGQYWLSQKQFSDIYSARRMAVVVR